MSQAKAFAQLAAMSARDMLRNRLTFLAPVFLWGWLIAIYGVLSLMLENSSAQENPLRAAIPSILMAGIAGIAFMAVTVPLVAMRERGVLRLFGATPLRRSTFLAAQLPGRLVLIGGEATCVVALVHAAGFTGDGTHWWRLLTTLLIGAGMLFACALLLARRARNAAATHEGMTMLVMGLFVVSGSFVPPGTLPAVTTVFTSAIPSTWFAAALGADLTGTAPFAPVPVLWALMTAVALVAGLIASGSFEWDQNEPERRGHTHRGRTMWREQVRRCIAPQK